MRLEDININQLAFLRGIGMTETHFSEKEAYSEAYNQVSNNRNVREYGQDGADYGYYQTNALDVKDAIRKGVPRDIAIHLNGGGKNGKSTVEQQTIAMHYYLQKRYPTEYENVKKGTPEAFEAARSRMQGQWFGLKDRPEVARKEFDKAKFNDPSKIFPQTLPSNIKTVDEKYIQEFLKTNKFYDGDIDGIVGKGTLDGIRKYLSAVQINTKGWNKSRLLVGMEQAIYANAKIEIGTIDGYDGPQTKYARELWSARQKGDKEVAAIQNWRPVSIITPKNDWPRQADCMKYYGDVGTNQTTLKLPWNMVLAWDTKKVISSFSVHEKVHDSMYRCFQRIGDAYPDPGVRRKLGLDLWGGCLNVRQMRGGSSWSMHAWGIAIDFDPDRNQMYWGKDKARLAKEDCETFWRIWEEEGWVSLGRARNFDFMHCQAARI